MEASGKLAEQHLDNSPNLRDVRADTGANDRKIGMQDLAQHSGFDKKDIGAIKHRHPHFSCVELQIVL